MLAGTPDAAKYYACFAAAKRVGQRRAVAQAVLRCCAAPSPVRAQRGAGRRCRCTARAVLSHARVGV
eukprot:6198189-Pleurochrysis_carterae.AAC.1